MASSTKTSKIPKKESESLEMTVTEEKPEKFEDEVCIKSEFDTLCRELNMDTGTADTAWNYYCETKHKYTLEVSLQKAIDISMYLDVADLSYILGKFGCLKSNVLKFDPL